MKKIAVIYWSGTGNTEMMAKAVSEGVDANNGISTLFTAEEVTASTIDEFDAIAFGCPSMGAEELEESEFAPMFESCRSKLSGKAIGLFGSYGWGDGEWMRNWETSCKEDGAVLVSAPVICNDTPDEDSLNNCRLLGEALASH